MNHSPPPEEHQPADAKIGEPLSFMSLLTAWPKASLRTYLVVTIILATLPVAVLLFYGNFTDLRMQRERLGENLQKTAFLLAQGVEREMLSTQYALNILSEDDSLQLEGLARFERVLSYRSRLRPSWRSVYLLDSTGRVIFDTDKYPLPKGSHALGNMVLAASSSISNLLRDPTTGGYFTTIAVPVKVHGVPSYTLGARIDASVWQRLLEKAIAPNDGFITIFDRDYMIIARTLAPERFVGQRIPAAVTAGMDKRSTGVQHSELMEGGAAYGAWQKVELSGWGVGVGVSAEPLEAAQWRAVATTLATAWGCLLLGTFLAFFAAKRVTDPLHQLATKGATAAPKRIAVREIALLRDALLVAHAQDEAARTRLQAKRDLLERKANEFETLFDSSPIGLAFAQDPQCRVVLHNAAMDALFGVSDRYGAGEVRVLHQGKLLVRADQPLQRAAACGEVMKGMELEVRVSNKPPLFVLVNAVPLLDLFGRPRGAIGAVVDITDRKLAESRLISAEIRLRESQNLVELAQETGHVGFFQYQFKRNSMSFTSGHAKLFASDPTETGHTLETWMSRIDQEDRSFIEASLQRIVAERQEKHTLEYRITLPDGSARWLSSRMALTYADNGKPFHMIGITVDVTEQKIAEAERGALIERERLARLEAEAANRAKDEFLAMLGHELRNPLSAISSAVEVLNRVDGGTDIAANARRIIARQTAHLAHMMGDLLDVARVISGKVLLARQSVDLADLVRRVMSTLEIAGETRNHEVSVDMDEAWIDADATRIEQIVTNLLTNAIKYTPSGGQIGINVHRQEADVVFQVRDTGLGISPELLPRIFDLFVQGESTLDRRSGGLGIGLTLVHRLVELHGGSIAVESSIAGSIFTVRLSSVAAPTRVDRTRIMPESRRRRVAVIEDNLDALNALASMLELEGHAVWTAADGEAGLALVMECRPDVVLVDIGLPGIPGFEVARGARAQGYTGRMIALSGYGQESDVKMALSSGFDAYLVKPIDTATLRTLLYEV